MTAPIKTSIGEMIQLAASAAVTATGNGSAVALPKGTQALACILDLTNAATDAGDTLDVFIQTKLDQRDWVDIAHFTQILGNGSNALQYITKVTMGLATAEFEVGSALGAAAVRNLIGAEVRARWAVVDSGDADHTFTFSVECLPMGVSAGRP